MSSFLLTVLAVTALPCCLILTNPVQGQHNCPQQCPTDFERRIISGNDLINLCSTLAERTECVYGLSAQCRTPAHYDMLNAIGYVCRNQTKSMLLQELAQCIQPNQTAIDQKYSACKNAIPQGASSDCHKTADRACAVKALRDCCPLSCGVQDSFIFLFDESKHTGTDPQCPWDFNSGSCDGAQGTCV